MGGEALHGSVKGFFELHDFLLVAFFELLDACLFVLCVRYGDEIAELRFEHLLDRRAVDELYEVGFVLVFAAHFSLQVLGPVVGML